MHVRVTLAVINITWAVVEIKPEKNSGLNRSLIQDSEYGLAILPNLFNSSNVFFRIAVFQQICQFTDLPCSKCAVKLTKKLDTQRL